METKEKDAIIIGAYAPDEGREHESDAFYEELQKGDTKMQ